MRNRAPPRRKTHDDALQLYAPDKLGETQSMTPEGYLLCTAVPIARTGVLLYGPGETPVEVGSDGIAYVSREREDLFAPDTVASFQGKAIVDDHPDADVTPANWNDLSVGVVLNVRTADAPFERDVGLLLADLLITNPAAIRAVRSGKREVSCGYDADYDQTGPGLGRQTNIIGNHVALVERGRCGPRCSIGDRATIDKKEPQMATKTRAPAGAPRVRVALQQRIRKAFRDAETDLFDQLQNPDAGEGEGEGMGADPDDNAQHIHIHMPGSTSNAPTQDEPPASDPNKGAPPSDDPTEARFQKIEATLQAILEKIGAAPAPAAAPAAPAKDAAPEGGMPPENDDQTDDPARASATHDSAALATGFQAVLADAEVLVPGIRIPTFDSAAKRRTTVDALCKLRTATLQALDGTSDGQALLKTVGGAGVNISAMDCAAKAVLFRAAAGAKRLLNNATRDNAKRDQQHKPAGVTTMADVQAAWQKLYPNT